MGRRHKIWYPQHLGSGDRRTHPKILWLVVCATCVVVFCVGCVPKGYILVKKEHMQALRDGIVWYVTHSQASDEKTQQVGRYIMELANNLVEAQSGR